MGLSPPYTIPFAPQCTFTNAVRAEVAVNLTEGLLCQLHSQVSAGATEPREWVGGTSQLPHSMMHFEKYFCPTSDSGWILGKNYFHPVLGVSLLNNAFLESKHPSSDAW